MATPTAQTLAEALRAGPFHEALRLAIRASGLTMERVEAKLRLRELPVSVATLSYWQRGQVKPRRAGSRLVVRALEDILALPDGALLALLDGVDGAGSSGDALARLAVILQSPGIDQLALGAIDRVANYTRPVSVRQQCVVSGSRTLRAEHTSAIRQAQHDDVDRTCFILTRENRIMPTGWSSSTNEIGRACLDEASGALAVELLLDRPLSRGESCLVDYDVEYPDEVPGNRLGEANWDRNWGFGSSAGFRDYCITMRFSPKALPRRVVQFWQPPHAKEMRDIAEIPLSGKGTAQYIAFDLPPGFVGLRWEY
jgi:hypothetical protein